MDALHCLRDYCSRFGQSLRALGQSEPPASDAPARPPSVTAPAPSEAHPNLRLTYERARELEASLARNAGDITNKGAAQVAIFGFAVVGVLSAIDRYIWGFVQWNRRDLLSVNYGCLLLTLILGVMAAINLSRAFSQTQTVYPWAKEMRNPELVVAQDPDNLLLKLVTDLNESNEVNARIVRQQNRHLASAARSLVILSVLIVFQTGYNALKRTQTEAQASKQEAMPCRPYHFFVAVARRPLRKIRTHSSPATSASSLTEK